jgi:signal transduction histidine kinase
MEQFSYMISHNLRSPVANVMGLAEELKDISHDAETKEFLLTEITNNIKRLDNVILDLNSILQIKSELSELKEPVSLKILIEDIKSSISNLVSKEHVEIITSGIEVDDFFTLKSFFHSIFYNLISNSIKYRQTGTNPVIEIKSWEQDGTRVLTFNDNGRGLDLGKHKDQIFGLYKRFHTNIEGKGMGLFMVKTQVEVLGGTIAIDSEIDSGTKFTLTFPI